LVQIDDWHKSSCTSTLRSKHLHGIGQVIILADSESDALIKKKWLTKLFVCGDVMSFLVQIGSKLSTHSIIHHQDILTNIL